MSQLDILREKLYEVLEKGSFEDVLKLSQELDNLILFYMKHKYKTNKMSA